MSFIQRFIVTVLPRALAEDMKRESSTWMARCPCGAEFSVWDLGGIRWKAKGNPRRRITCRRCGKATLHTISRATGAS